MVPPRLTLVSDNTRDKDLIEPATGPDASPEEFSTPTYADPESVVDQFATKARREKLRRLEAQLFAASEPLDAKALARHLDTGDDIDALLAELQADYRDRGVSLVRVAGKWQFRTAEDLSYLLERQQKEERKLSKAALETLAIIAYHQPVTRAEIEDIRGVSTSPGTLDVLMETSWIRPRGRRRAPGRPLTYGTTEQFLSHFGLDAIRDLPGLADLRAAGLLDSNLPPDFKVPEPTDVAALMPDELPLTDDGEDDTDEQAADGTQDSLSLAEDDQDEPGQPGETETS
ncbi:MAG: SMC-Scp complex subunit ScpB [Hyphomicrobium sp.]|nr:MAG: SMC-Scp complex subunit ScpB [Hyphomicrobium sp.]PPC98509.1 MAG: SMC-Scp complex subunit ScpB [Hyphomicrobium sp.]